MCPVEAVEALTTTLADGHPEPGARCTCRTALIVEVPAAERVVGEHRRQLDHSGALGLPAHLTVLFPFVPHQDLGEAELRRCAEICAGVPAFDVALSETSWFGEDVVWLAPDDPSPLRALTAAFAAAFPAYPPYGGAFDSVVPHLTIGDHGDIDVLQAAELAVLQGLPVTQQVVSVSLWSGSDSADSWVRLQRFPLG
jgi:2'-5' RNA ligase